MSIGDNRFAALGVNPDELFVLYPHNRGFLTGERLTPDFRPSGGVIFAGWFITASMLVSVLILIFAVLPTIIAKVGTLTEGQVIQSYDTTDTKGRSLHIVEFSYAVNKIPYDLKQQVNSGAFTQAYLGTNGIKVKYLPFAPNQATIVDAGLNNTVSASVDTLWVGVLFEVVFLTMFAGSFYYSVRLWQLRRRRIAAWTTASLVVGQVVSCTGTVVTTKNRTSYEVTLAYQYQSPRSNQMETGKETNRRNDLMHKTLPQIGTLVVVVAYNQTIPPANPFRKAGSDGFVL